MKLNPEFRSLIPPLTSEEYIQLEKNIIKEGCRDDLILWGETIIDGHNRYEICQKHNIDFNFNSREFKNENAVKQWIILNQFARRNLSAYDRAVLALKLEDFYKEKAKERMLSGNPSQKKDKGRATEQIAKKAETSRSTIEKVREIEQNATSKQKERVQTGKSSINAVYKEIKRVDKQNDIKKIPQQELKGKYNVLYADVPWQYDNNATSIRGVSDDHYPTMNVDQIKALPVKDITLDNAVLFFWTTTSMIRKAFDIIDAWGFSFKTSMVWVKNKIGTGFYVRSKHEILLIAVKGSFLPMTTDLPDSVVFAKTEKHSKKPDIFYKIIEKMYPNQKYIELFARNKKEKWVGWGLEYGI